MKKAIFILSLVIISLLFLIELQDRSRWVARDLFASSPSLPPLVATEKEVQQFFANYIECYTRKDLEGFLSLFSPKALQNQRDGMERIREVYASFFNVSQEIRYRTEDMKIGVYQNAVEVKARYEIDQTLKKKGKKIWQGQICWVIIKESGALKILSLDYQHHKSP